MWRGVGGDNRARAEEKRGEERGQGGECVIYGEHSGLEGKGGRFFCIYMAEREGVGGEVFVFGFCSVYFVLTFLLTFLCGCDILGT